MHIARWVSILAVAGTACSQEIDPELGRIESKPEFHAAELWFNNKLRPDLQPLSGSQSPPGEEPRTPFVPELLSASDADRREIVSDISLVRTGEFAGEPIKNTRCLWLAPSDEIKLHWETAARLEPLDEDIELIPGEDEVGFCTGSDPYTRMRIHSEDDGYWPDPSDPPVEPGPPPVEVRQRGIVDYGAFVNAHDECILPGDYFYGEPTVATAAPPCHAASTGHYPGCAPLGCSFDAPADTHYELANEDPDTGHVFNTRVVEPVLKRVSGTRQMIRPMREVGGNGSRFTWSVAPVADGRWTENFSTNLRITSFRMFGLLPSGQRVYLHPDSGVIGPHACSMQVANDHSLRCGPVDPSQWILNPAYEHTDSLTALSWEFLFNDDPRKGGVTDSCCEGTDQQCCDRGLCAPLCEGNDEVHPYGELQDTVYIEFTLIDLEHIAPDLFASPARIDFGPVESGASWHQPVSVKNTGGVSLDIVNVEITGASDLFAYALPAGAALPYTLAAGAHVLLDVQTRSGAHRDEPLGQLIVTARAPGGAEVTTTTHLRVTPYFGPEAVIFFPNVAQNGGAMHLCEDATELPLLVDNYGDRDLTRGGYSIAGQEAGSFTIAGFDGTPLGPTVLPPGDGDLLRIYFTPDPAGPMEQRAEVVATSDARNLPGGEIRVPIIGFRDTSDNQPGCDPWFSLRRAWFAGPRDARETPAPGRR